MERESEIYIYISCMDMYMGGCYESCGKRICGWWERPDKWGSFWIGVVFRVIEVGELELGWESEGVLNEVEMVRGFGVMEHHRG